MRLALATDAHHPNLPEDERQVIPLLRDLGIEAVPVVWSDESATWGAYDAVIVRSCWDYHLRLPEFLHWAEQLPVPLWNPPAIIRWNSDKHYLLDLAGTGIRLPQTLSLERGQSADLVSLMWENALEAAVVKPAVSANAHATSLITRYDVDAFQPELDSLLTEIDVMVQAYIPEIVSEGELSMVFLGGEYSHTVRKLPAEGEFRVQEHLGGQVEPVDAPFGQVMQASKILEVAADLFSLMPADLLYARVDAVPVEGELMLMELELIEPSLFLDETSARRFAHTIHGLV